MNFPDFVVKMRSSLMLPAGLLACFALTAATAQTALQTGGDLSKTNAIAVQTEVISLDAPTGGLTAHATSIAGKTMQAPANYRQFADARAGEPAGLETLTLRFAASTKLTKIEAPKDFKVEQGGSCVEGNVYSEGQTCRMLVRFTPQGPGHRFGRIAISHTASPKPMYVGLGGNGYAPVISFTPAVISTVPASYPGNVGLIKGSNSLSVDGGDTLYVADTGNNVIRSMDSSNKFITVSTGTLSAPYSVVADNFGDIYFDEPAQDLAFEIFNYGSQLLISGAGTDSCTPTTPCKLPNEKVYSPGQMSIDPNNQIFAVEQSLGAMMMTAQPYAPSMARIYDPFTFQNVNPGTLAVDAYDNIYSLWSITNVCEIVSQYYSDAANSRAVYQKVAGGKTCGYAGDGGLARNAEIGAVIPQFAFDVAGDMYFSDTANQRVRRIDAATGIINTIAGTGVAGYNGDGGAATLSAVSSPTGIGVDSAGQVYFIQNTAGSGQLIRKLGPDGAMPFGGVLKGLTSAARTVTLTNTGNSAMTLTRAQIVGAGAAYYTIDPTTTTCNLTAGATLANGQSCKVGVVFKPLTTGTFTANLQFLDNTVTNVNNIQLYGVGLLPNPTMAITSPAAGASFKSGTTVQLAVSVTSATTPAPTGTVKFFVDGAAYGNPVTISGGAAAINLTGLTTSAHTLGATYSGDANYAMYGPLTRSVTVTAAAVKAAAVVKTTAVTNPAVACKSVVFATTVSAASLGTPTGVVQLKEGATVLATGTLTNGAVTVSTSALTAGTHSLTAYYAGDANHNASSVSLSEPVGAGSGCSVVRSGPIGVRGGPVKATRTF